MAAPYIVAGEACVAGGACVAAAVGAPVWAGVLTVTVIVGGTVYVASKAIDSKK